MGTAAAADPAAWAALRAGGHAALVRHANAPGTGDPPGFRVDDCATQRNLDDRGRAEAAEMGAAFRREGVAIAELRSSRWCRARDTARLMGLGDVTDEPALDSFFASRDEEPGRTAALRRYLSGLGGRTVVLVTHQVNITALTGLFPRSGEVIVVRAPTGGGVEVIGRIAPPD